MPDTRALTPRKCVGPPGQGGCVGYTREVGLSQPWLPYFPPAVVGNTGRGPQQIIRLYRSGIQVQEGSIKP